MLPGRKARAAEDPLAAADARGSRAYRFEHRALLERLEEGIDAGVCPRLRPQQLFTRLRRQLLPRRIGGDANRTGKLHHHPPLWRNWPGFGYLQAFGGVDAWPDLGRQCAWPRLDRTALVLLLAFAALLLLAGCGEGDKKPPAAAPSAVSTSVAAWAKAGPTSTRS